MFSFVQWMDFATGNKLGFYRMRLSTSIQTNSEFHASEFKINVVEFFRHGNWGNLYFSGVIINLFPFFLANTYLLIQALIYFHR